MGHISTDVDTELRVRLADVAVGMQLDVLVLDRLPQPLDKHVIAPAALAVHAARVALTLEGADELAAGELTALVGVHDLGRAVLRDRLLQRLDRRVGGQAVRQPPRQHPARGPIDD